MTLEHSVNKRSKDSKILKHQMGKFVSKSAPRVSIIIPAYNVAEFIAETLDSVRRQSFTNYEVILVNDGSRDTIELENVITPFSDSLIYIWQENGGASSARNTAIRAARGDVLAFLDGDDLWEPRYLEEQIAFLDNEGLDMVYCDALLFGETITGSETFMDKAPSVGSVTTEALISATCNVITSGTILKKSWLQKVGMFDLRLRTHQDFDMWFKLAKHGARIGYQTKSLVKYRVRSNSISGSNLDRARRNVDALKDIAISYGLSTAENDALNDQMRWAEAQVELETAKEFVVKRKFAQARAHLLNANKYYGRQKLRLAGGLLRICPGLVRWAFKTFQPAEFMFISGADR